MHRRLVSKNVPSRAVRRSGSDFEYEKLSEHAELAFEHRARPDKAARGKLGGEHAALRGAAEMEALHHAALSASRERQQPAGARAGDAEGVGELIRRQCQHLAARGRRAERPDDARGVKALELRRMQRCRADAKAHLAAGDDRGHEIAAAAAGGLGHGESGQRDGRAGMRAGAGLAQAVQLEGMGEGAERQRRLARIEPRVEPRRRAGARAA